MKVKLFSHTDLDGVGCAIVAVHAFGIENVDIVYCDYHNVDEKVESFFLHAPYFNYDLILITDISVNDRVAALIETKTQGASRNGWDGSVVLLDHHPTAVGLNKYHWATVTPIKVEEYVYPQDKETMAKELRGEIASTIKTSGTTMLYDYVVSNSIIEHDTTLHSFAEQVRRYDTWDWQNVFNDEYPKRLNDLMYIVGRQSFFERFTGSLELKFTLTETLLVENEEKKIKKYIDTKNKQLVKYSILNKRKWYKPFEKRIGLVAGVVFADQYISELGNALATANEDVDFIIMADMGSNKISYRGIKTDKIDLGKFAKTLGGGGHAPAAGSQIDVKINESLVPSLFKPFNVKKIS